MKNLFNFFKHCFHFKNNFFILFIVIFTTFISVFSINYVFTNKNSIISDFSEFDKNSFLINDGSNEISSINTYNSYFKGLDYSLSYYVSFDKLDNTLENKSIKYKIYGVDIDFLNYPLEANDNPNSVKRTHISQGELFSNKDYSFLSCYYIMDESYIPLFNNSSSNLIFLINGVSFLPKGFLKTTNDVKRELKKESKTIQLFIPKPVFKKIFSSSSSAFITGNTHGESFENTLEETSVYTYDRVLKIKKEKISNISSSTDILSIIIMVLSIISISILIFVNIKSRAVEIGLKRAIGASRDDIIFELSLQTVIITYIGIIVGFLIGVYLSYLYSSISSSIINYKVKFFDFNNITFTLGLFLLFSLIAILLPISVATKINISEILQGEK